MKERDQTFVESENNCRTVFMNPITPVIITQNQLKIRNVPIML